MIGISSTKRSTKKESFTPANKDTYEIKMQMKERL